MKTISETEVAYRKALEKVLEDSKCGVVPKSHIEAIEDLLGANQKEDKNDWYERGELPPVGAVCEMIYPGLPSWLTVEILLYRDSNLAISGTMVVVCAESEKDWSMGVAAININTVLEFRPLQKERERLIERATRVVKDSRTPGDAVKLLTDAGMLKMPEDK